MPISVRKAAFVLYAGSSAEEQSSLLGGAVEAAPLAAGVLGSWEVESIPGPACGVFTSTTSFDAIVAAAESPTDCRRPWAGD